MGLLQELNEERKRFKEERERDKTRIFDISEFSNQVTLSELKDKSIEIANKSSRLLSYLRLLHRQKNSLRLKYKNLR